MGSLWLEQFGALYIKNALVAWRARRATLLRLIAPFFFLLLALLINVALRANDSNGQSYVDLKTPSATAISPIPTCHEDLFIGSQDCLELAYSPNNSVAQMILGNVTSRNAKPIRAMGFASRDAVQAYLLANPDFMIAAVHLIFDNDLAAAPQLQGFVIQTNTTAKSFKAINQNLNTFVQLPLQSAMHREIARYQLSISGTAGAQSLASNLAWYVGLKPFAHPAIATVSVLGRILGPFIFAACMFAFVTQIGVLVMEKEMGLRQAMRTMGMRDSTYWMSWAAWEFTLGFVSGHLIACFGLILQFDLFLKNSYGVLFFLFFLFQLAMSSLAMLASSVVRRTQTAVYIGFVMFLIGWIMQTVVIFGVPYVPNYAIGKSPIATLLTIVFSALPWNLLMKGFLDLGSATVSSTTPGIKWNERKLYCQNIPNLKDQAIWAAANNYDRNTQYVDFTCVMPFDTLYWNLVALWLGYLLLAVYLDNVIPNEFGISRPLLFFFYPSYWSSSISNPTVALTSVLEDEGKGTPEPMDKDEDVAAEESRVRMLLNHRTGHTNKEGELAAAVDVRNAIEIFGLKKKFGGSSGCCGNSVLCCSAFDGCSCRAQDAFWPMKGTWLNIKENQLFCLLGPNGAGKTTIINCLTGALPPTYGDALIHGQSIRSTGGMDKIRSLMGVCPQFDVLWPELTGKEHLMLYGRLKGCGWHNVQPEAEALLEKVKLTYAGLQRSGAYSGGMKRRLSVAIALLGDPKVVYLDEPTTGMDPISRRYVWDIIQEAKVGRAIVLTTHSMEEADILGDKIAIMALGRLRCLGSSLHLKQRFGKGYQVAVSVQPARLGTVDSATLEAREQVIQDAFKSKLNLTPEDVGRVYTSYLVPRHREADLVPFLAELEQSSVALGITDIQLSLTSLEEVFLKVARQAALEAAQNGSGGRKKKDLAFCSACLKVSLLALTIPISIFLFPFWKRFLVGKTKDTDDHMVTLPDGSQLPVEPGQDFVSDAQGQAFKILWAVDENGHLVAQEAKPMSADALARATSYPAVDGKARVPLPGNILLEVQLDTTYVLNPQDGKTYFVKWGKDHLGRNAVLSYQLASELPPQTQTMPNSGTLGVNPLGMNRLPIAAVVPGGGLPVGEALQSFRNPVADLPGFVAGGSASGSGPK